MLRSRRRDRQRGERFPIAHGAITGHATIAVGQCRLWWCWTVSEPGSNPVALVGWVASMTAALVLGLATPGDPDPEEAVCGTIKESLGFWTWRTLAGRVDDSAPARVSGSRLDSIETTDGRVLRGLVLEASTEGHSARGYLLVAQGNAMLADRVVRSFAAFQAAGLHVHIYDYRGYGRSTGKSRLKAIVADYRHIIQTLNLRYGDGKRYICTDCRSAVWCCSTQPGVHPSGWMPSWSTLHRAVSPTLAALRATTPSTTSRATHPT